MENVVSWLAHTHICTHTQGAPAVSLSSLFPRFGPVIHPVRAERSPPAQRRADQTAQRRMMELQEPGRRRQRQAPCCTRHERHRRGKASPPSQKEEAAEEEDEQEAPGLEDKRGGSSQGRKSSIYTVNKPVNLDRNIHTHTHTIHSTSPLSLHTLLPAPSCSHVPP